MEAEPKREQGDFLHTTLNVANVPWASKQFCLEPPPVIARVTTVLLLLLLVGLFIFGILGKVDHFHETKAVIRSISINPKPALTLTLSSSRQIPNIGQRVEFCPAEISATMIYSAEVIDGQAQSGPDEGSWVLKVELVGDAVKLALPDLPAANSTLIFRFKEKEVSLFTHLLSNGIFKARVAGPK